MSGSDLVVAIASLVGVAAAVSAISVGHQRGADPGTVEITVRCPYGEQEVCASIATAAAEAAAAIVGRRQKGD